MTSPQRTTAVTPLAAVVSGAAGLAYHLDRLIDAWFLDGGFNPLNAADTATNPEGTRA
jgi:hypothetical protein